MPYPGSGADRKVEQVAENPQGQPAALAQFEGEPSGVGKPGIAALAKWRPSGASVDVDNDGDWTPLQVDADGGLFVKILGSVATTSATGGRPLIFYYGEPNMEPWEFSFPTFEQTEYQWAGTQAGAGQVNLRDNDGLEVGTNTGPLRVAGYRGTKTNRSGSTSGTPGTSTQVMAANSARRSLFYQNVSDTIQWIRFGASAVQDQPSIKLLPNSVYWEEGLDVDTDALHVICSAASKSYTAYEK